MSVADEAFRYRSSAEPALDGGSFRFAPGEVLALVGPNGPGETTLIKLLLRLYNPDRGSITIDGVDLKDVTAVDVRRSFSVLLQGFGSYAFTARGNVRLGDVSMTDDDPRIISAAEASGAAEEVRRLPRGWETVLGTWFDDGRELNAGQWQKLALARALARGVTGWVLFSGRLGSAPIGRRPGAGAVLCPWATARRTTRRAVASPPEQVSSGCGS